MKISEFLSENVQLLVLKFSIITTGVLRNDIIFVIQLKKLSNGKEGFSFQTTQINHTLLSCHNVFGSLKFLLLCFFFVFFCFLLFFFHSLTFILDAFNC